LSGKQHFVGPDQLHGFHERLVPELYPVDFAWAPSWEEVRMESNNDSSGVTRAGITRRSVQLEHDELVAFRARARLNTLARDPEQPFFMWASFTHPHEPYFCRQEHWDRYRHDDIPMPTVSIQNQAHRSPHTARMLEHHGLGEGDISEEHVRTARHAYLGNVSLFDDMVGALLATLAENGQADNTIIVVTADHGDMLGEHGLWFKKHFLEHASRVPLIVHAPARFATGRVSSPVSLVDLLPTLTELAGSAIADTAQMGLDGASLVPLMNNPAEGTNRPVFAEITSEGVPSPMFMVRQDHHKLLTGGAVPDQLFDLTTDPTELHDLSSDPSAASALEHLRNLAAAQWDTAKLDRTVRLSQRRRHLINASHTNGDGPHWEHAPGETLNESTLRGAGLYNDWAWTGID
jgi:choline-sulfatase